MQEIIKEKEDIGGGKENTNIPGTLSFFSWVD